MNARTLVAKVSTFAPVLRDQGVSCQACISRISCLLFLKMDELVGRNSEAYCADLAKIGG